MNKIIIPLILICLGLNVSAQNFNNFIEKVNTSHPGIIASQQLLTADEAESRTGLTPDNPVISGGFFPGNSVAPGDKITWSISQSFDFPTRYARIKSLKKTSFELARMEYERTLLQVLNDARLTAIELIASRKLLSVYYDRQKNMIRLEEVYKELLDHGETTAIEYNKIRIKRVNLSSSIYSMESEIAILISHLDYMSGNSSSLLASAGYPLFNKPDIDSLLNLLRNRHPDFLIPEKRIEIAERGVNLSKSENLPGFEVGYGSEIVADERFTGPSLGITIPLWKNRGNIKRSIAESVYQKSSAVRDILILENRFKNDYYNYVSVEENLETVESALKQTDNRYLLDKSLEAGEISVSEYIIELTSFYDIEDLAHELKKKKYLLLSNIFRMEFSGIL